MNIYLDKSTALYLFSKTIIGDFPDILDQGIDIDECMYRTNSLYYSISQHNKHIIELLLSHGANPNKRNSGKYAYTPLIVSILHNDIDLMNLLLSYGADPNMRSELVDRSIGKTPLIYSCAEGRLPMVKVLVNIVDDINAVDNRGSSALMHSEWYPDIVEYLLNHGADINHQNNDGDTILTLSIVKRNVDTIRILLMYNPDPYIRNNRYENAFSLATSSDNIEIKSLILDYVERYIPSKSIVTTCFSCIT